MNKLVRNVIAICAVLAVFSGCSFLGVNPEKDGDKIVKEGLKNFYDVNVASFNGALKGNFLDAPTVGADGKAVTPENLSVDVSFSGSGDMKDPKNLLLNLKFDGTGALGKQGENASGELKINKTETWFLVSKLSSFGGMIPEEMVKPFLGQWWKTQTPQDMIDSLPPSAALGEETKLTPEEKKARELLKRTQFFSGAKYIGEENGDYHYSTALDNEAVKNYVKESAKISGETVSEDQLKTLDENLKNVQFNAEFWVGVADQTVHKLKLDVKANDTTTGTKMDAIFDASISDINKAVTVEVPKDAKEFAPNALLGGAAQAK